MSSKLHNQGNRNQSSVVKKQFLSMEQWCEYAKAGVDIPVTTLLHGRSMEPLIRFERDAVTVVPLKREPEQGDIVLFERQDGVFVVHRFLGVSPDKTTVQTWGDNCPNPDAPIKKEAVLGLVVSMNKKGKTIPLDTKEQRAYGIKWLNNCKRRKLWFALRKYHYLAFAVLNKLKKFFK